MLWTLAVIADSGREMYETMVRPLTESEREGLWQDYVRFGELFGLPRSEVPGSYREFSAWWDERLSSPDLQATEHGLEMAPLVAFEQPVPAPARGNIVAQNHIIKGTLPPRVREIFGIRWSRAHETQLPRDDRRPPPRPPLLPPPDAPRPQRRLLRRRHQGRAPARRHRDAAAARRRLSRGRQAGRGGAGALVVDAPGAEPQARHLPLPLLRQAPAGAQRARADRARRRQQRRRHAHTDCVLPRAGRAGCRPRKSGGAPNRAPSLWQRLRSKFS